MPMWSAGLTRAVSGVAAAIAKQAYPRWRWRLSWEFLSDLSSRQNLASYSQDLSIAAYTKANCSVALTSATVAPDVTYTAWKLTEGTATAAQFFVVQTPASVAAGNTYTTSIYAKAAERSVIRLQSVGGTYAWFNLATGAVGTVQSGTTATMVSVGNGWYRCAATSAFSTTSCYAFASTADNVTSYNGDGVSGVYFWGFQVEPGAIMRPYVPATSSGVTVSDAKTLFGFVNSVRGRYDTFLWLDPDFNTVTGQKFGTGTGSATAFQLIAQYSTDGSTLGALGAPDLVQNVAAAPFIYKNAGDWRGNELQYSTARTNLVFSSQTISGWTINGTATVADASTTAPDGTTTASLVTATVANSGPFKPCTVTTGLQYTGSAFVKYNSGASGIVAIGSDSAPSATLLFNTQTGVITSVGSNVLASGVQSYGSGWYRVYWTFITTGTTETVFCYQQTVPGSFYLWGAQLERGSVATAYIPTTTGTVTVTDYTLSFTGLVTFATAPASGAALTWSGSFYYRARFTNDAPGDFGEILSSIWELKSLEFESELI